MSNVRPQMKDLLGEVLLLNLIQLRSARGHHIIGWGYKRVPARKYIRPSIGQYNKIVIGAMRNGLLDCHIARTHSRSSTLNEAP